MVDTPSPDNYHDFLRLLFVLGRADQSAPLRIGHQGSGSKFGQVLTTPFEAVTKVLPFYRGENLWFEINESSYLEPYGRSSEGHITRLTALWADLDYKGDDAKMKGMGSEQGCRDVIDELTRILGVLPAAIVHSGNGLQAYWPLEAAHITAETGEFVKLTLLRWKVLVQQIARTLGGAADSVFDFPRIMRIPGPPNMKDPQNPKPTKAEFPEGNEAFTVEEIADILDDYDIIWTDDVTVGMEPVSVMSDWSWAEQDCDFVGRLRREIETGDPAARHPWGVKVAATMQGLIRYGCVTETTFGELTDLLKQRYTELVTQTEPVRDLAPNELSQMWQWAGRRAESWSDGKLVEEMRGHSHMLEAVSAHSHALHEQLRQAHAIIEPQLPAIREEMQQEMEQAFKEMWGEGPANFTGLGPIIAGSPQPVETLVDDAPAPPALDFLSFLIQTHVAPPPTAPLPPFPAEQVTLPAEPVQEPTALGNVTSIYTGQPLPAQTVVVDGQHALDLKSKTRLSMAAFTDTGNSERLATAFHDRFITVPSKGWFVWQKNRFVPDITKTHVEAAKDVFISMASAYEFEDEKAKWARKSLNRGPLLAGIGLAESHPSLVTPLSALDANGYELCTPAGIVNIRTGELRPASPRTDRHTLQTGVAPDEECGIREFLAFIHWAMSGDQDRVDYLQRLFGVALIGDLLVHIFPMFIGAGGNGKGTLLSIISMVMGTYAKTMPKKFLVEKPTDQHPTEIANLQGTRLAVSSEVPPKAVFDEELVKTLSGDVTLTGRFMREDLFEFPNVTLNILLANHLPTLQYGGGSFQRRLRKVDFREKATVEDGTLDKRIFTKEGPGILAWMLEGARQFLATGEQPPPSVMEAARVYMAEEDTIGRFIDATYNIPTPGGTVQRSEMFREYEQWARSQRLRIGNQVAFDREIMTRYPDIIIEGDDRAYINIVKKNRGGFGQ